MTVRVLPTERYFSLIRAELDANEQACVRVTGESMKPLLRHMQDTVIIAQTDRVKRGDIILYDRKNGRYALHRVIKIGDDSFSMAGDNQRHTEHGLRYDQIVGTVNWICRGKRRISMECASMRIYANLMCCTAYLKGLASGMIGKLKGMRQ